MLNGCTARPSSSQHKGVHDVETLSAGVCNENGEDKTNDDVGSLKKKKKIRGKKKVLLPFAPHTADNT